MKKVLLLIIVTLLGCDYQIVCMNNSQEKKQEMSQFRQKMRRYNDTIRAEKEKAEAIIQTMSTVLKEYGDSPQVREAAMHAIERSRAIMHMIESIPPHLFEQKLTALVEDSEEIQRSKRRVEELIQQTIEQKGGRREGPAVPATAAAVAREDVGREQERGGDLRERQQRRQEIRQKLCSAASPQDVCIASIDAEYSPLIISRKAAELSPVLDNYIKSEERANPGERPLLMLENSYEQVTFITKVLLFLVPLYKPLLVLQGQLEKEKVAENRIVIEQQIAEQKQRIVAQINAKIVSIVDSADISFVEAVELAHFYDLTEVFDALVGIQKPMPIPQTAEEIKNYNDQLVGLFSLAQKLSDNRLWRLLGRMLYPCHDRCPLEIEGIVQYIEAHRGKEWIVLDAYMSQQLQAQMYTNLFTVLPTTDWQTSIAYSPDGSLLATASSLEGAISLWNMHTNQLIIKKEFGEERGISNLVFSPDGTMLVAIVDGNIVFLDSRTLIEKPVPLKIRSAQALSLSPTDQTIAIVDKYVIRIYSLINGLEINNYSIGSFNGLDYIATLNYSSDGKKLAVIITKSPFGHISLSDPKLYTPYIIDLIDNSIKRILEKCSLVRFSNDSKNLITDRYIWDLAANALVLRLPVHSPVKDDQFVSAVLAIHPFNSDIIAVSVFRNIVHVFQINGPNDIADDVIVPTDNEMAIVNGLAFHPYGTMLAVTMAENNIRLFGYPSLRQALLDSSLVPGSVAASAAPSAPAQAPSGPAAIAAQGQEVDEAVVLPAPLSQRVNQVQRQPAAGLFGTVRGWWGKGRDWWKGDKKK